ncbi:MAG: MoaD/ThiS family protein [Planctomycetes bacterium]|nr:MoaD/ThiS family protein [Planctomycetota bacterium]
MTTEGASGTIEVEVLLFARARELAGRPRARLALPAGSTVAEAARRLERAFPALSPCLKVARFAVNEEFASEGSLVPDGAVLAVIPPVSGGV